MNLPSVKSRFLAEAVGGLSSGQILQIEGIIPEAASFVAAYVQGLQIFSHIVLLAAGSQKQDTLFQDLTSWYSIDKKLPTPFLFPSWEVNPTEEKLPDLNILGERLKFVLHAGFQEEFKASACLVLQPPSLLQKTYSQTFIHKLTLPLNINSQTDPLILIDRLEELGYERVEKVTSKGEYAARGGIIDIFPISHSLPVRAEFFGDEIDSLREFNPASQISCGDIEKTLIPPAGELGLLNHQIEVQIKLDKTNEENVSSIATSILDFFPTNTLLIIQSPEEILASIQAFSRDQTDESDLIEDWCYLIKKFRKEGGRILILGNILGVAETSAEAIAKVIIPTQVLGREDYHKKFAWGEVDDSAKFKIISPDVYCPFPGDLGIEITNQYRSKLFDQIAHWKKENYTCILTYSNDGERERILELWSDFLPGQKPPEIIKMSLSYGFVFPGALFALITESEIFCRRKVHRTRKVIDYFTSQNSQLQVEFAGFEEGDLVVHLDHGIGKFLGIGQMPVFGGSDDNSHTDSPECLIIEYAPDNLFDESPKLYVPVTESHLVSKYVGIGRTNPPLNHLGGTRWNTSRTQAQKAVADIASDLLRLQAVRESAPAYAYPPDTEWQTAFENSFEFQETPDQLKAIEATKQDMESSRPMDRLICGDVGFGKTEVAVRAAFKAVMSGKQVALLAPTTILVQQHYNTFKERMAAWPIVIQFISRFKSKKEQEQLLQNLEKGNIDIIIGTHRLLQNDLKFKDLGLFIIDEEQRFGVKQKEKIKRLKTSTDVLTLSATPIPRTLYMALTGVKSMSCIETPPIDRLPVKTIVCPYDNKVIKEAIQRELNRQGQVFFLHNRVQTIDVVYEKLKELFPEAKIAVGHGQMEPAHLEKVMKDFIDGKADILLATTIIESGLDIPNANTLIIDRADRFGLSELYQLRGRVGRSTKQAYAYLMIPRHLSLVSDARKRIAAIKQYSKLGAGFKIAVKDLEIRGAGNILGAEQSGHITAVGFDLYCKLLQASVARLRGENVPLLPVTKEVKINLDFVHSEEETINIDSSASNHEWISQSYISDIVQRVEIYRRLGQCNTLDEIAKLQTEIRDRFGKLPLKVEYLLEIYRIRILARNAGIEEIEVKEGKVKLYRNKLPIMINNSFPRLKEKSTRKRLKEILNLLGN